jgi:hypothetical protein
MQGVAFRGATGVKTTRRAAEVMGVGETATLREVSRVSLWRWESPSGRWKRDKVAPPILDATHLQSAAGVVVRGSS